MYSRNFYLNTDSDFKLLLYQSSNSIKFWLHFSSPVCNAGSTYGVYTYHSLAFICTSIERNAKRRARSLVYFYQQRTTRILYSIWWIRERGINYKHVGDVFDEAKNVWCLCYIKNEHIWLDLATTISLLCHLWKEIVVLSYYTITLKHDILQLKIEFNNV